MVEPDNIMIEHLRAIRAKLDQVDAKIDRVDARLDAKIDHLGERIDGLELKLDGLTHAVIAGFGSVVHELDAIKERVTRLETERA